jgi:hypothetical protein
MTKHGKLLVFWGLITLALFNYPLLEIFSQDLCLGGVPLLLYYLFGAWLLAIVVLFLGKNFLSL